jgi:hypothetical protein
VEVCAYSAVLKLSQVSAAVVIVADVEGLVHILNQMHQKEQGKLPLAPRSAAVGEHLAVLMDLRDNAAAACAIAIIELMFTYWDVHVVPRGAAGHDVVTFVIGPVGDIDEGVTPIQQLANRGCRHGTKTVLGDSRGDPMCTRAPCVRRSG